MTRPPRPVPYASVDVLICFLWVVRDLILREDEYSLPMTHKLRRLVLEVEIEMAAKGKHP